MKKIWIAEQGPKLLDRVHFACRRRYLSPRTEKSYRYWIRQFILYHHKRHPVEMGVNEVEAFLNHLAVNKKVAASTQSQALNAIVFLYKRVLERDIGWMENLQKAKQPERLPVVFTQIN